uniref:Amiloride-sensitive sodium channel n=1 Tax=Ditylenchus dipsaci TaxID=166011 RepID=A0A915EDK5_9BILA
MADPTFGNCYTFNFDRNKTKSSIRAGATHGLRVSVYVNASEYLPITESVGVRITIHDQDQFPFPDTFGYNAPTGFISSFGMKLSRMSRLPTPYGDCQDDETKNNYIYRGYRYSIEGCYRTCFQEMVVKECGCADPRFPAPPKTVHCEVFNSSARKCLEDQTTRLGHLHELSSEQAAVQCRCRQPCKQSVYTVSYSAANWPSQSINMSSIGQCPFKEVESCEEYFQENGAMIESEAYGLVKMMADFGGQLGLWSGVSFMTCVEFLFFFFELIIMVFKHHYYKQKFVEDGKEQNKK